MESPWLSGGHLRGSRAGRDHQPQLGEVSAHDPQAPGAARLPTPESAKASSKRQPWVWC